MTWIIAVMDTSLSVDPSRLLSLLSRYRALYQARSFMLLGRCRVRLWFVCSIRLSLLDIIFFSGLHLVIIRFVLYFCLSSSGGFVFCPRHRYVSSSVDMVSVMVTLHLCQQKYLQIRN